MRISKKIKQDEINENTENLINWGSRFFLICIEQSMIKKKYSETLIYKIIFKKKKRIKII